MKRVPRSIILLATMTLLSLLIFITPTGTAKTLTVDDDWVGAEYNNISAAVGAAEEGDIVRVHSGFYKERIRIDRSMQLIGNNSADTYFTGVEITNETWLDHLIYVTGDDVTISGFNLSWETDSHHLRSIYIISSDCMVSGCEFTRVDPSIEINGCERHRMNSTGTIVSGCVFYSSGVDIFESKYNEITENDFLGYSELRIICGTNTNVTYNVFSYEGRDLPQGEGISIENTRHHLIMGNVFHRRGVGISLTHTRYVTIDSNRFQECGYGITTTCFNKHLTIMNNSFISNTRAIFLTYVSEPRHLSNNEFVDNVHDVEYQERIPTTSLHTTYIRYGFTVLVIFIIGLVTTLKVRRDRRRSRIRVDRFRPRHRSRRPW